MTARSVRRIVSVLFACVAALAAVVPSWAQAPQTPTSVAVTGGAAGDTRRLPAGQAEFGIRIPLRPNAENIITVTASNDLGQRATKDAKITQITLGEIVRAQVTAQRLTTQEVKALVADGVIDVKDPANFNVSIFIIVLTINGRPAQVSVPVITPKDQPLGFGPPISIGCSQNGGVNSTERAIAIPCGDGGGGGGAAQIQIIPFEIDAPGSPVEARVPGVIIIEGRIKTLKEFFKINLLLMNVSAIFNLKSITARLEVPEGALTHVAPASGTVSIPDIGPGGENSGQFIVRGDRIGTHTITAHFGAELVSPFLDAPVPISGSASTDLDVKGPPKLGVTVEHPNFVRAGEVYDLVVHIQNEDEELDALYTTFELDVGLDAQLVDPITGEPLDGPSVHELGDILRGKRATQAFKVRAKKTGPISSCTAAATQNIKLSVVFTGQGGGPGCAIGTLPSLMDSPDGKPTVVVVPTHNTTGVSVDPAITAIFSAPMITETITAGFEGATFRVVDPAGGIVPGYLQFGAIFGGTVAAFRPNSVLAADTEYTVVVEEAIFDEDGLALSSGWTSRFRTEGPTPAPDVEAPQGTLVVEPPVNPDAVTKGQLVPVVVESSDNVAVTRVDLYLDGELVDTKRPNSPVRFMVDTAALAQGSAHALSATLRDEVGNQRTLATTLRIAGDVTPPALSIVAAATVAKGRTLGAVVEAADDGRVDKVQLFVDAASDPAYTVMVPPFSFTVATGSLAAGSHTLRAMATDGAGNTAQSLHTFDVVADAVPPSVVFLSPAPGAEIRPGTVLSVVTASTDDIGVASVEVFLDAEAAPRSTGIAGFNLPTIDLSVGGHRLRAVARDLAGNTTTAETLFALVVPVPDSTPPPAPLPGKISAALPANGIVLITGLDAAVEGASRVELQNVASLATAQTNASAAGAFSAYLEGNGGQMVSVVAIDVAGNRSQPTLIEIPRPATLTSIAVIPVSLTLNRATVSRQLSVTGTFSNASIRALAGQEVTFTSLDPTVAAVSASGLVLAGVNGSTMVHVLAIGAPPVDVPVTVAMPTLTDVTVSPNTVSLRDIGRTQALTLTASYSDGFTSPYTGVVTFASLNPAVASVDSSGLITGLAVGDTTITVAPADLPVAQVSVSVRRKVLNTISVSPGSVTLIGTGQTQTLTVTGFYSDGTSETLVGGVSFVSQNAGVAAVANGVVASLANGTTAIDVTVAGAPAVTVPVTVKSLASIAISPASFTLIGAGTTRQLSVTGTYTDGSTVGSPAGVVFETTNAAVGTVAAGGLVTANGVGGATIRATLGALAPAESLLTVIARQATQLIVTPASRTFTGAGESVSLDVVVRFNDNTTGPPTGVPTFVTANGLVASVNAAGLVTAVANGSTSIGVTADGLTVSVAVTVDIPPVSPPPVIDSLDRPRAAEGDRFAIRGRHFGATPASNQVFLDGTRVDVLGARVDELVAQVPVGAASGAVTVVVNGQTSNPVNLALYARRATSAQVTGVIPAGPGPVILPMPGVTVRDGDRVLLSSAPDILAPLSFTGTLTVAVDAGAPLTVFPSPTAVDLTGEFDAGVHDLQLRLEGASVSTGAVYLVVGPNGTGPIAGERSVLSVNHSLPTPVTFTNLTGLNNLPLADGAVVAVSTVGGCFHRDRAGTCLSSAGGRIANGANSPALPGDVRVRNFVVSGGRIDVVYDPLGTELEVSSEATATVSVIPTTPAGTFSGSNALAYTTVRLTSIDTVHAPRSQSAVLADGQPKIVGIDLQDFRDSAGNPVPDVKIAVSTIGGCFHRDRAGACTASTGGDIANGALSPEVADARLRVFTIANDAVDVQYSPGAIVLPLESPGTALVQVLPARPSGARVGNRTFSDAPITLSSASAGNAEVTVTPQSVLGNGADNRVTIVVRGIVDGGGNTVPNGTKISVSTVGGCFHRDADGACISSAGGVIVNGAVSPDVADARVRVLETVNGQVEAIYSAEPIALETPQTATARISFTPANASGARIGSRAFIVADVALTSIGSASTTAVPPSVVADGLSKTVVITVTNIRDEAGNPVPDGAVIVASTVGSCFHRDRDGACISSAGGVITNGDVSPDLGDNRIRYFTVASGRIVVHYDPQGVLLSSGDTATANVQLFPGQPNGRRVGNRAFVIQPVALSSVTVVPANVTVVPVSVYADGGTNRAIVTVTGITDGQGRPVPNGTKVVVSTLGSCFHRDSAGGCISGTGGTLDSGAPSPEVGDARMRVHDVVNGSVQAVYNSAPNAFATGQSDTAFVQFLPATPAGVRIGNRTFALAAVTVAGPGTGQVVGPGSVTAGGQAAYVVNDLRDLAGVPLPDGTRIVVSAIGSCFHRDAAGACISSAGGTLVGGAASPEFGDARFRVFTVQGGSIAFTFEAPASGTSVLQLLPATQNGTRIGNKAFVVKAVSITP